MGDLDVDKYHGPLWHDTVLMVPVTTILKECNTFFFGTVRQVST